MSIHRIHIPTVIAEELLELPEGVFLHRAVVEDGRLVIDVVSEEDLGAVELDALYGNEDEDETTVHFGMFQPRLAKST